MDMMKFKLGRKQITFNGGGYGPEGILVIIEEAKKRNLSIRLGPDALADLRQYGDQTWSKKGIVARALDQTVGRLWRLVGAKWDVRANEVLQAVKDCEANYQKTVVDSARENAEQKVVDTFLADLKKDPALNVLRDAVPALDANTPVAAVKARMKDLQEARICLNDKLQLHIEQERLANPGNEQLLKLQDEYAKLVGVLDNKLAEIGRIVPAIPEEKGLDRVRHRCRQIRVHRNPLNQLVSQVVIVKCR